MCLLHSKAVRAQCAWFGVGVLGEGVREVGVVVLGNLWEFQAGECLPSSSAVNLISLRVPLIVLHVSLMHCSLPCPAVKELGLVLACSTSWNLS